MGLNISDSILQVLFAISRVDEFTSRWGVVLLIFALYCWASLPLTYLFSFLFSVPSTALVRITIFNIITGLASIITMNVLRLLALATPSERFAPVRLLFLTSFKHYEAVSISLRKFTSLKIVIFHFYYYSFIIFKLIYDFDNIILLFPTLFFIFVIKILRFFFSI